MKKTLLFLTLSLVFFWGYGQSIPSIGYSVEQGLPSSEAYDIFQDSKNRLWICTDNGVSLLDGENFENFGIRDGLPSNTIFSSFENKKDRIVWFITYGYGICYYDEESGKFKEPPFNHSLIKIFNKKFINSCKFDTLGNLWIAYDYHHYLMVRPNGKIEMFPSQEIAETGGCEILSINGIQLIRNLKGPVAGSVKKYFASKNGPNVLIKGSLTSNYTASDFVKNERGITVIANSKDLIILDKDLNSSLINLESDILALCIDLNNKLWIGTVKDGIYTLDLNKPGDTPENLEQFRSLSVSSIIQDKNHKIWFTTLNYGLYCMPNTGIRNFFPNQKIPLIYKDLNQISIVSQSDGIYTSDFNMKSFSKKIGKDEIKQIRKGPDQKLYFCKALYNSVIPENIDRNNISASSVEFMKSYFFVGGKTFLLKYDYKGRLKETHPVPSPIIKILRLNDQNILLACLNGLYIYNDPDKFIPVSTPEWIARTRINEIKIANDRIFVLTDGKGMLIYDNYHLDEFKHFTIENTSSTNCIHLSSDNILWLGTNEGLYRFKLHKKELVLECHYSISDGLPSNEINDISFVNKQLLVATNKGLSVFSSELDPNYNAYPLFLKYVTGNFLDTLFRGYSSNLNLKIPSDYRNLSFKFSSLGIRPNQQLVSLNYKLFYNGGTKFDWSSFQDRNVQFTNLQPGRYTLLIEHDNPLRKSKFISRINFEIEPKFHERVWVKILFWGIILSVTILLVRFLWLRKLSANEFRKRMALAEINSLRNQMNPHFIFNALNGIQNFIFENDQEKASRYLNKFSKLIRQSLEFSKLNFINIRQELEFINEYLKIEKMRFPEKFEFEIKVGPEIDMERSFIPPLLMQPLIENSIKHGFRELENSGRIDIELKLLDPNTLQYSIIDNGCGLNKLEKENPGYKTSLSLNILRERFELLKSQFKNNKLLGMEIKNRYYDQKYGTCIVLKLPLIYD
ncbi:MAG: histidine kinase [Flavobacteriales bacterium]|nr:histidine kinase [Flavobacteriales bacterium]